MVFAKETCNMHWPGSDSPWCLWDSLNSLFFSLSQQSGVFSYPPPLFIWAEPTNVWKTDAICKENIFSFASGDAMNGPPENYNWCSFNKITLGEQYESSYGFSKAGGHPFCCETSLIQLKQQQSGRNEIYYKVELDPSRLKHTFYWVGFTSKHISQQIYTTVVGKRSHCVSQRIRGYGVM